MNNKKKLAKSMFQKIQVEYEKITQHLLQIKIYMFISLSVVLINL
jgi:hypothetical protein